MQSSDSLYMKQPSDRLDKINAILMGLKYSIDFTVAFFKSQYFYSCKNCHSLWEYLKKCILQIQKTKFDKYANSEVSSFIVTSIYLFQFIMDQNCRNSC